ncbi:MAG: biotin--[acetyl-CoA-carboxylase] ligase [Anaerolineaceae bacterium]|nr:biotin--[acetyl-CoA-carboxylase] ligase [Anaerolineaceae bacterium]
MSDWKHFLNSLPIAAFEAFDEVGSTNDVAMEWVHNGAEDRSLVIADRQTQGRGRMGRSWQTTADASLAFSYILKPNPREIPYTSFFSPLGALAVCEVIMTYDLQAEIKWPNDVLLNRKKVAGILSEIVWINDTIEAIVIGIGVNIATESIPDKDSVLFPASSVAAETGKIIDRMQFLADTLAQLDSWRLSINSPTFFDEWNRCLAFKGEQVKIQPVAGVPVIGTLVGINPFGAILIRDTAGVTQSFLAGDVHLRPVSDNLE